MIATNEAGHDEQEHRADHLEHHTAWHIDCCSQRGVRDTLEDCWAACDRLGPEGHRTGLLIADGVGGLIGGDLASGEACRRMLEPMLCNDQDIERCFAEAHEAIQASGGPATTAVLVVVEGDHTIVAWVGDSRAWILDGRTGQFHQLTQGHVGTSIGPDGRRSECITRWLGHRGEGAPQIAAHRLGPGDRIVLTTDGVHGFLTEDEIAAEIIEHGPEAASAVVELALDSGSMDNATCVVASPVRSNTNNLDATRIDHATDRT